MEDDEGKEVLLTRPMPKENKKIKDQIVEKNEATKDEASKKEDVEKSTLIIKGVDEDILDGERVQDRLDNIDGRHDLEEVDAIKENIKKNTNNNYQERIDKALELLEKHSDRFLMKEGLEKYSPKFLALLENIINPDHQGLHLIYSQFRTLEGIGIFSMILKANGFARFKIKKCGRIMGLKYDRR